MFAGRGFPVAPQRKDGRPATTIEAAALVAEAERWLLWHRLTRGGILETLRWHASLRR